jgi:hypothetical protein
MAADDLSPNQWEDLADMVRSVEPLIAAKIEFWRSHPSDPITQPVTSAIISAYVSRLEFQLYSVRGGVAGLKYQFRNYPQIVEDTQELELWITRLKPPAQRKNLSEKDEEAMGNWFVSKMGYSYSQAKHHINLMREQISEKGAPDKRPETLKMLDARIVNGWSYAEIARRMCDCEAKEHTDLCRERIRKRIKELETVLAKYRIAPPPSPEKNPR